MKTNQNRLREFRERKNLTQQQVADHLGFKSTARISKWEKGIKSPNVTNFTRLIELYEVPASEVYQ